LFCRIKRCKQIITFEAREEFFAVRCRFSLLGTIALLLSFFFSRTRYKRIGHASSSHQKNPKANNYLFIADTLSFSFSFPGLILSLAVLAQLGEIDFAVNIFMMQINACNGRLKED
jgi:Na+/melibiose symporter-like transporter